MSLADVLAPAASGAVEKARILLVALHVPYVAAPVMFLLIDINSLGSASARWPAALCVALLAGGLSLRHSLAVAAGHRPRGWPLSLGLLVAVTVGGVLWIGSDIQGLLALAVASVVMLAPRWAGVAAVALLVAFAVSFPWTLMPPTTPALALHWTVYPAVSVVGYSLAVPLAATLVRTLAEVRRGRDELAEQSVTAERVRVARDVHDLVGQTLTAVSLKGELALRLLPDKPAAARAELADATELTRHALHVVRGVAHHRPAVSLAAELAGARALLSAAGVQVTSDIADVDLPAPVEEVLAWAVREGTTNVLRHSSAVSVEQVLTVIPSGVQLTMRNDGADRTPAAHSGLQGLADRAEAVGGRLVATAAEQMFVLTVEVPQVAP